MTGRLKTKVPRVARLLTSFLETTVSSSLSLHHSKLSLNLASSERVSTNPVLRSITANLRQESRPGRSRPAQAASHHCRPIRCPIIRPKHDHFLRSLVMLADAETWDSAPFRVLEPKQVLVCCWGASPTRPISRGHVTDTSNRSHSSTTAKKEVYQPTHASELQLEFFTFYELCCLNWASARWVDLKTASSSLDERRGSINGGLHSQYLLNFPTSSKSLPRMLAQASTSSPAER